MTTGRINQVTILNPGTHPKMARRGGPPRGAECYRVGEPHEVVPAKRGGPRGRGLPPGGYSIAPTEFPKETVRRRAFGSLDHPCQAACAPRVEGRDHQSTPRGGYWRRRSPLGCKAVGSHRPSIHRPHIMVPTNPEAGRALVPSRESSPGATPV